ncbi:hypothetical protein AVEN_160409-1, partial [Araneus ventricosus]
MKSLVYETPVDLAEDLVAKIFGASDKIKTPSRIFERMRRCELCREKLTALA